MQPYPADQPQQQPYPPQQSYPYPPQSPYAAPPPPVQPKKRRRWPWVVGILLIVLIAIIAAASANSGKGTPTSANGSPTAAPGNSAHKVGDAVTIGGWQVVVNGVTTSNGDSFTQPKTGNTFVLIDVTVTNTASSTQPVSSLISFDMKDASGQKYTETIVSGAPNPPDGNVAAGSKVRGTLAYELPTSAKTIELDFTPSLTSTDVATWSLTVP